MRSMLYMMAMFKGASFENMSGGGGGKALSFFINTKPENTVLVQSTPLVLRSMLSRLALGLCKGFFC